MKQLIILSVLALTFVATNSQSPAPNTTYSTPISVQINSTVSASNSTTEEPSTTTQSPVKCPPQKEDKPDFLADPSSCDHFYVCNGGRATKMHCPAGLLFNQKLETCDWPRNVNCTLPA